MPELLTPGVYFEEAKSVPGITQLRTDITFFAGIAERGPLNRPVRIDRWEQFRARFGDFQRTGYLAYAVKAYFENGGDVCWISRVAASELITQTAGPQPADRHSSSVSNAAGLVAGAVATLTQPRQTNPSGPQPADRLTSTVVDAVGFPPRSLVEFQQGAHRSFRHAKARDLASNRLDWDVPLDAGLNLAAGFTMKTVHRSRQRVLRSAGTLIGWEGTIGAAYDLGAAIEIATGASAAALDVYDEHARVTLQVKAIDAGSWGDRLAIHVSRSSRLAARTVAELQPAGGETLLMETVMGFRQNQLVRIFQPGAVSAEFRLLTRVNAARSALQWAGPLPGAFNLVDAASGARPISIESMEFALSVLFDGRLMEVHSDLSLAPVDSRYFAPAAIARSSRLISVEAVASPGPLQDRLPNPSAANLTGATGRLFGGRNGTAAIGSAEFLAALNAAANEDEIALLAVPDLMIRPQPLVAIDPQPAPAAPCSLDPQLAAEAPPPEPVLAEQAPDLSLGQIERIQQAMLTQCEQKRDRFAVLDPPPPARTGSFPQVHSWRRRFDSKFGALYHPWILAPDPLRVENSPVRRVPPSGAVTGIYARVDLEAGVHYAPANRVLKFTQGPVDDVSDGEQDILNPMGVNCIRYVPGRGLRVWGARTVSSDPEWRFVNVRRLMSLIEEALDEGLAWAVFQPNNGTLRSQITASVTVFLESFWERGALVGATPEEAFYIRCDDDNNPPGDMAAGRLMIEIGVALVRPAEFVVIRLGRINDSFEIEEKKGRGYGSG